MNRFDDYLQRVNLLNAFIRSVEHDIGSPVRKIAYGQLWAIIAELNTMLNLGLDNTALDLRTAGNQIVIHTFSGVGGSQEYEISIFIDSSFAVERHTKTLATGVVETTRG